MTESHTNRLVEAFLRWAQEQKIPLALARRRCLRCDAWNPPQSKRCLRCDTAILVLNG